MGEPTLKVYGLFRVTRGRYIALQIAGFAWWLALYFFWRWARMNGPDHFLLRNFDLILFAIYLGGLAETFVVLRKFKRLKAAATPEKSPASS